MMDLQVTGYALQPNGIHQFFHCPEKSADLNRMGDHSMCDPSDLLARFINQMIGLIKYADALQAFHLPLNSTKMGLDSGEETSQPIMEILRYAQAFCLLPFYHGVKGKELVTVFKFLNALLVQFHILKTYPVLIRQFFSIVYPGEKCD